MIDRPDRAMVVTPHPDDAEIGCGGTVAQWIREGTRVVYVLCTNGDKGTSDPDMTSERLAEIREREQAEAAALIGVEEVIYLSYPDGGLEDTSEFREHLVRAIRQHRPEVALCPDPHRTTFYLHRDHRICGQVTMDAVFPYARDRLHYPEHEQQGLAPHKVGEVLFWGTENPDEYIDVTDTIQAKIDALRKHDSQVGDNDPNELDEFIRAHARRIGERADVPYAESFRRIQIRS